MTNGGFIFFNNIHQANNGIKILNKLHCKNKKIFEIKKFNKTTIYYKISLKSLKIIDESDVKNNLNFEKFLVDDLRVTKKIAKKKDISDYFIKEIEFLKTTGVHIPQGIVLHENFYSLNKLRIIENHKLFNHIQKHLTKR
jgi:hypothetical protein